MSFIVHRSSFIVRYCGKKALDRIGADLAAWPAEVDITAMLGPRQAEQQRRCPSSRESLGQPVALDRRDQRIARAMNQQRRRAMRAGVADRRCGGVDIRYAGWA